MKYNSSLKIVLKGYPRGISHETSWNSILMISMVHDKRAF
jgi:hypothetical protein